MYRATRLKLTGWYILMIMFVSLFFSVVIYANVDRELTRLEKIQEISRQRAEEYFGYAPPARVTTIIEQNFINDARGRLVSDLAILNGTILLAAAWVGYFLAGRTLNPIKRMLDVQARFIGDASHELKTPLTSLRTEIEIYLHAKKKTLASAEAVLKSNLEEVVRLSHLTESLMELSYLENSNLNLPFEKVNLQEVINEVVKTLKKQSQVKSINIAVKSKKILLLAHRKSIYELVTILVDNAIKYSPKKSRIEIITTSRNGKVYLKVKDSGIGIEKSEQSKIFERFYRSDKSRSTKSASGYGLGLSIAKEIVRLHGGAIWVESTKKGSLFIVELQQK